MVEPNVHSPTNGNTAPRRRGTQADLDAIRSRQWPLPSIAALVAVAGPALTLWQLAAL